MANLLFGLSVVLWWAIGVFAMLANVERTKRVWGDKSDFESWPQHVLTLLLGPVGLALVMASNGRMKFWAD